MVYNNNKTQQTHVSMNLLNKEITLCCLTLSTKSGGVPGLTVCRITPS